MWFRLRRNEVRLLVLGMYAVFGFAGVVTHCCELLFAVPKYRDSGTVQGRECIPLAKGSFVYIYIYIGISGFVSRNILWKVC